MSQHLVTNFLTWITILFLDSTLLLHASGLSSNVFISLGYNGCHNLVLCTCDSYCISTHPWGRDHSSVFLLVVSRLEGVAIYRLQCPQMQIVNYDFGLYKLILID